MASYLKHVTARSDILNSKVMLRFLGDLDKRAPDVLPRMPKVIERIDCNSSANEQFYVTHCEVVESHSLMVLCLNDAKNKTISKLEIYSFKY